MNEQELLHCIEANKKGKCNAGLATWQCCHCSKRPRVDPPAAVPVWALEMSHAPQATPTRKDVISVDTTRASAADPAAPTMLLDTTQNSDMQATSSRPPTIPTVIEINDDTEMVDISSLVIVPPPTPVSTQAPVRQLHGRHQLPVLVQLLLLQQEVSHPKLL